MTDPQVPQTPASSPPPSPLGVDPKPDTPIAPVVAKPAEPAPSPAPAKPTISQEEIDSLLEKASNYDLIAGDPELSSKIRDHFQARTGRVPARQDPPPATPQEGENAALLNQLQDLRRQTAAQEVALFRMQHPDVEDHKENMAKLMTRYGMTLDDAYNFSKAFAAQQQKNTPPGTPAIPTVETTNPAGLDQGNDPFDLAEVERKIADSKATPRFEDAIDLAIAAARRKAASK